MKPLLLCVSILALAAATVSADDLGRLAGKWSLKKPGNGGDTITQTVEIKGDKFTFEVLGADGQLALHAEGEVKLEKLGPFNTARFFKIRAGGSATDLNEIDEEYNSPYMLDGDTWTMASNFDKDRDQKPAVEAYHRTKAAAAAAPASTLVIDAIEMADTPQSATWFACFQARVESVTRQHYVKDKGYDKNAVTIPVALELPGVRVGQKCSFKLQLDDIDDDACTEEVDNRSTGEFAVTEKGSQSFKPESNWRYTIRWHVK